MISEATTRWRERLPIKRNEGEAVHNSRALLPTAGTTRRLALLTLLGAACAVAGPGSGTVKIAKDGAALAKPAISADQLVREVVQNEIRAQEADHTHWIYNLRKKAEGKDQTWEVVETKEGALERLVSSGGHELSPQEQEKENARTRGLVNNAEELKKKQHEREEDGRQAREMLKLLPEAFLYTYDSKQSKLSKLTRLNFKPNPAYHPATREATVFHNMEGFLLVDGKQKRLAQIDGTLTDEVKFGGGLLGHLQKGGHFSVKQANVGEGHWEVVSMAVHMMGKALMFKTISVEEEKYQTNFRRAPDDLTLASAAELMEKGQLMAAKKPAPSAKTAKANAHN